MHQRHSRWGVWVGVCRNSRCDVIPRNCACVCSCAREKESGRWVGGDALDLICARRWPGRRDWSPRRVEGTRGMALLKVLRSDGSESQTFTTRQQPEGAEARSTRKETSTESCVWQACGNFSSCVAAGCFEPGAQQVSCCLRSLSKLL